MGEVDTKPIDSVQIALSFFEQPRNDHRRNVPMKDQEVEKERGLISLEKDLSTIKIQLEAKESAYKQALHKIDQHQNMEDELMMLLINTDFQKDFYISECREGHVRINELESSMNQLAHKISESEQVHERLSCVTSDLESTRGQLLNMEKELSIIRDEKAKSLSQAEAMESALSVEKVRTEELMNQLSDANETIMLLKAKALEVEREKAEVKEQLENELMEKSACITVLEAELKQLKTESGNVEDMKSEFEKIKEKENQAQVEIALLNSELHKGRSKLAAAEAAESRAQGEKSALYNALQQMGLEAEEIKKENRTLKEAIRLAEEETRENKEENVEHEVEDESCEELESVKKELETAVSKIGELRTRAEQAISRAEAAERAKASLEDKMKRRKEHKARRKAALAALREESVSRDYGKTSTNDIVKYDSDSVKSYQPLGKVLNMKF